MGKDKLKRFAEIATFPNVLQQQEGIPFKNGWSQRFFKNASPLILELACGKGEYTVNLARLFPGVNYIGIDYKGNRIWRGAKTALENGIGNVGFLRIQIEHILEYFGEAEVDEIWITFPDPQPQISREKKRLTSPRFLEKYRSVLKPGGYLHLKTDNDAFFDYSRERLSENGFKLLEVSADVYRSHPGHEVLGIQTYYEKKYLLADKNINYLKAILKNG
jgi:tRNA (guanine-N7-)-methyltransferase